MDWALLIPLVAIGMPIFIVWIVHHYENKNKEQVQTTLQKLIESGQELSPEVLENIPGFKGEKEKEKDQSDVRKGFILIGVGIGIALLGDIGLGEQAVFGAGLLVLSIGVGMLAYGVYSKNKKGDDLS